MVHADPGADPLAEPGAALVPAPPPVAAVEQVGSSGVALQERADEAGVDADIAEASAPAQHPGGFGERGLGVVEVGMGQDRDDRVERSVGERQGGDVGGDQDGAGRAGPLPGYAELVAGQVNPDHPPAPLEQAGDGDAGAAAEVEAGAGPGADQPATVSIAVVVTSSSPISRSYQSARPSERDGLVIAAG